MSPQRSIGNSGAGYKIVADEVAKAKTLKVSNGAAVAIDPRQARYL